MSWILVILMLNPYLKQGLLSKLKKMRKNYKVYQREVRLSRDQRRKLEKNGIEVLMDSFLALCGHWHWFTGSSCMDAFRLSWKIQRKIEEEGYFEVIFEETEKEVKEMSLDISKFDPESTLFIVSCTYKKIWDCDSGVPDFVPARYAYRGNRFLKFLKWMEENKIEEKGFFWVILSGKYGFIEPWHPITRYDIYLGNPDHYPISDESLKNQVKQKRWWRNNVGELKKVRLEDFSKIICVNCDDIYLCKIKKCFPNAEIHVIDMDEVRLLE